MKTALVTVILLVGAVQTGAIDFSPRIVRAIGEGGAYEYLRFKDAGHDVTYMPPRDWRCQGSLNLLRLTAPNESHASATITVHAPDEPLVADLAAAEAFRTWAQKLAPAGATKIKFSEARIGPSKLDGHETVEVEVSYVVHGHPERTTYLFLPRLKDLLVFTVTAPPESQDRIRAIFYASLHTLSGI